MKDSGMKERLRVEELEENKEELKEVAEDVFPVIVFAAVLCGVLLLIFLLRLYIRWGVQCPSKNRMDGKTVIITGEAAGRRPEGRPGAPGHVPCVISLVGR